MQRKHTAYQPSDEEWKCPKCGAGIGDFIIEEVDESKHDDCEKLHKDDFMKCYNCGHDTTGNRFAAKCMKEAQAVVCQHCHGKGVVYSGKSVAEEDALHDETML